MEMDVLFRTQVFVEKHWKLDYFNKIHYNLIVSIVFTIDHYEVCFGFFY